MLPSIFSRTGIVKEIIGLLGALMGNQANHSKSVLAATKLVCGAISQNRESILAASLICGCARATWISKLRFAKRLNGRDTRCTDGTARLTHDSVVAHRLRHQIGAHALKRSRTNTLSGSLNGGVTQSNFAPG
jgi:hypothetical protein